MGVVVLVVLVVLLVKQSQGKCYLAFSPGICYLSLVKPDTSYLILASRYMFSDDLYMIALTVYLLPKTCNLVLVT